MKSLTVKMLLSFNVALVLLSLVACRSSAPTSTPLPTRVAPHPFDVAWEDRTLFREGLIDGAQEVLDRLPGASVYHIDLEISQDLLLLEGREEVCYTNREDEPLDAVYFRLYPNVAGGRVTVSAVKVDGQDVEPAYEFEDSGLRVSLPATLKSGEQIVIEMGFRVEVAQEMAGNYGLFGYFDNVLVLDKFYPVIPVYDDEGWNVEVVPPNGDLSYFDASFYLVRVTGPADLTVVASGAEVGREYEGKKQVLTFAAGPVRDFYLAASDDYAVVSEMVGGTRVNSYAFTERDEGAELALEFGVGSLRSYNERFGTYPYTEFDVVGTPMLALGIEYPGLVGIALALYDPDAEVQGLPSQVLLESVVAHEVAHQWFYNIVGNDQVDEPWLDEAVVQYATWLYYVDAYGERAAEGYRDSWMGRWDSVDRADVPIGLPSGTYAGNEYGAIVYGRGPLFIEALAEEMGQGVFDEFLRDYYESHQWGIGTGEAFRQLAEAHCQCDLTALFEEWVYEKTEAVTTTSSLESSDVEASGVSKVNGWAVLAQKDDYSDVEMTDLPVDHIGITTMRRVLEDAGWESDQIHDLREFDRESLQHELDWLAENADEDDVVFLYVAAHGRYLRDVLGWDQFFADEWEQIPSHRRLLVIDSCQAANYTAAVLSDGSPYLSIAAVAGDEYGWSGLEEEGLPIIGGVFTHYFGAALGGPDADTDADGLISVQEAALMAEEQQRSYMHDVVFAVPEFVEMYHSGGSFPDEDPTFPDVIIDDTIGEPLYLTLNAYP